MLCGGWLSASAAGLGRLSESAASALFGQQWQRAGCELLYCGIDCAPFDGVNDRPSDAAELAKLCRRFRLPAHVNLIPLNPTPGYPTVGSPLKRVHEFRDSLEALGVNATVRRNRGTDIDAACGQLRASVEITAPKR
jgi:hypothetical protein